MIFKPLPPLIKALLQAGRYPDPAQRVDLIETHASWLLLAGDFAYKIKKPITLPFLDYGTLEKRRVCCAAELRLNRRFAPELYLGVRALLGTPENPRFADEGEAYDPAHVLEFAVKMRRFAEAGRLDHLCARGELQAAQISALADALANFHGSSAIAAGETRFGSPAVVSGEALENFTELRSLLPNTASQKRLGALHAWTAGECKRLAPHFVARKASGRVRECHGDLHLGNLALIDGRVTLFDCIEFNEDFRWIDVASEVAFTYVDLLDHRQPGLAGWLLNEWLIRSGDYQALPVLRFYATYRALVRAKVAAIRARQGPGDFSEALGYLTLAEGLVAPPQPRLIITHGLSGCGKTRASARLILDDPSASTLRLRSDVERKRLFGLNATDRSGSPIGCGIYGQEANQLTYQRLYGLAQQALAAGWSTVVDAAFLKRAERDIFRALADAAGADFFILAPLATPDQLRQRIQSRLAKGSDASEATLAVLEKQMTWIEALGADEGALLH
jgi:aminoglycoside phosphotransferase family enzyme/predicted kinase